MHDNFFPDFGFQHWRTDNLQRLASVLSQLLLHPIASLILWLLPIELYILSFSLSPNIDEDIEPKRDHQKTAIISRNPEGGSRGPGVGQVENIKEKLQVNGPLLPREVETKS